MEALLVEYIKSFGPSGLFLYAIWILWKKGEEREKEGLQREKELQLILTNMLDKYAILLAANTTQNALVGKGLEDLLERDANSHSQ